MPSDTSAALGAAEAPALRRRDEKTLFRHRAARFDTLAPGHKLGDYLGFMAALARAQQAALDRLPQLALPDAASLARAREHTMPPLAAQSTPRDAVWREGLRQILTTLAPEANDTSGKLIAELLAMPADKIERIADRILRTEFYGPDSAAFPFVAAALQVYWAKLVAGLAEDDVQALDVRGVCPACGFLPLGSVIGTHADIPGLRYAECALCGLQWHVTRASCMACAAGEEKVAYRHIEGDAGLVQAEACDACHTYFKLLRRDRDAGADLAADDLATLPLDILLDEEGYSRGGPNLLFVPG